MTPLSTTEALDPAESGTAHLAAPGPAPTAEVVRIRPSAGWRSLALGELWRYRELLWFLALRDVKLRYKQTALGVAWAVIQPLFTMIVFSIFFGRLAGISSDGVPYPLFNMCALLPWQLFAYALTQSSNSVVNEQRLITKVYFPRLLVPLSSVLSGLVDFAITFVLLLGVMAYYWLAGEYGGPNGWALLTIPFFVVFALATALAVGLWLAALNVQYRDFRYTIPFLTQFWMFASPVAYPSSLVQGPWRSLYGLNPMAGVIEGFRWAILGKADPSWGMMAVSVAAVAVLLTGGLFYFRRMERNFADVV
jgi:lipopolysaccharide transport system permease protein